MASVALSFTVAVAILSSLSAPGGAVLVLMLALAPPGIILDKMSFNGSLQREWLLLHQVAELPRCADQVVAALEVDEVFSLDDLRRLEGHPRFDSCGLSADNGKLPDLRGLCFGTDSLVGDGSNRGSDSTEDLLCSVEDPVGFLLSMMDRLYGPYSGSERSKDEQFDSSVEQVRSSDPPFSRSALRLCPIGGASQAAPVPRGFAWLRSAWPSIVERWLLLGPRRQGEDDFSLLSRLGYYHDDRYGEDCYGWVCSGDVGWPADHLGGRIFQPLSSSQLDAAWAHRMWRRALQSVQAILMGPSGSAWLALRSAERLRHEAFCLLLRERRISRNARSLPGMNRERHQPLANAEAAYLRAARHAEECRHRCRQTRALAAPAPSSGRRRHVRHHHLA